MAIQGHHYEPITDDMKTRFLDLIASGYNRPEAAKALDQTARRFRALCNPMSDYYDEEFARQYEKLTEKGGEHDAALLERLREATLERALRSSDRLLEKVNVIHDPDWAVHKPQAPQLNINNNRLELLLTEMPLEALQAKKAELERKKQGELPPAHPDIDQ